MTRFSPGIYTIINRRSTTNFESYTLDNVACTLEGDSMVTVMVTDWLGITLDPTYVFVHKVGQIKDSVVGNTTLYTG